MTSQKAHKLFQAKQAFARQVEWVRTELKHTGRTDHLFPALEFLEWLVRDMTELAGITIEVQAHARELVELRHRVANHYSAPPRKTPAKPKLRLVK